MENLDIKDFQSVGTAEKLDNLLMVLSNGLGAKITVDLLIKVLLRDIQPSINKDGDWLIGGITTGISAAGKTPELRTTENGIEWRYVDEVSWRPLVGYDLLKLKFSDLTPEQVNELKLKFSDLNAEEIESLKGDQGIQGVTGKSAYQSAQENGYQGTEEQFGTEQATIANSSQRLTIVEQNKQDKPVAGRSFLTPLLVALGAKFNAATGFYEYNGLTDITEQQAIDIYVPSLGIQGGDWSSVFMGSKARTAFIRDHLDSQVNPTECFRGSLIEVVNFTNFPNNYSTKFSTGYLMFHTASRLRTILGFIDCRYIKSTTYMFTLCVRLERAFLYRLSVSIAFADALELTRESIIYLINNSSNTTGITVTLHPTAAARLTPEDIALASSKNITIA